MARRRDLARRLATAQEDERRRVSRDLHDSVGQLLAGLAMSLRAAETAGQLPPEAAAKLSEARGLTDTIGREVHAVAVRLRPTSLDDLGLEAALSQLVGVWSGRSGVAAELETFGLESGRLPPEVETVLFRVVQESLTNVAKYARATRVSVVVGRREDVVTAVVEDDGAGFDPRAVSGERLGLVGMRERAAQVGGVLEIESAPGRGTTILARVPVGGASPAGGAQGRR